MAKITTIRFDDEELYERLRLYVYSRKILEPKISMSRVVETALREHFAKADDQ